MGWGGARANSGPKKGGAAQIRRDIDAAIRDGFALATLTKHKDLATGDKRADSMLAVSMVVHDAILAGEGTKVLAIWSQIAPKTDDGDGEAKGTLQAAFDRLKGLDRSQVNDAPNESRAFSTTYNDRPTDRQSADLPKGPFFMPQMPLIPPEAGSGPGTPGTPPAGPPTSYGMDGKNFENFPKSENQENDK